MERSIAELEERRNAIIEELNWLAISQAAYFDEEFYVGTLKEVDDELLSYNNQLALLKKKINCMMLVHAKLLSIKL